MQHPSRRDVLAASAAGVGFWVSGAPADEKDTSPLERLRFACIGVGGKGRGDSSDAGKSGDVVAICDVDDDSLGRAGMKFTKAEKFHDFRKLFDKLGKSIDAVTVSTPDHTHAAASALAMRLGKHCFTQKPLTRTIWEARRLGEIAREKKVVTQMGNQGTARGELRQAAALVKAGALGAVTEVHVWTNRPTWPQGGKRPIPADAPANLKWDLWLGPSPERPYAIYKEEEKSKKEKEKAKRSRRGAYHDFNWRGWWDFGTGALGDMACHTFNLPFMALDLRDPVEVEAETSGHDKNSFPQWSVIRFAFPARGKRGAVKVVWYDGGKRPDRELFGGAVEKVPISGSLIVGEKGKLFSAGDNGSGYKLLGDVAEPKVDFVKSPGHFAEWVQAIKQGKQAASSFPDYAGPLTETILLGNLAVYAGKKIEWDAKQMKAKDAPEVETLIRPAYRKGWEL